MPGENEERTLEAETPKSLFQKVKTGIGPIIGAIRGFRQAAKERAPEQKKEEKVEEAPPSESRIPSQATSQESAIRDQLANLQRQLEEEIKPTLVRKANKEYVEQKAQEIRGERPAEPCRAFIEEVCDRKAKTYLDKTLKVVAEDHVYLERLTKDLATFMDKRESISNAYEGVRKAYETLKESLENVELELGKVEYLERNFEISSQEILQIRANFLAVLQTSKEELERIEDNLDRIEGQLKSYSDELERLNKELSKDMKGVEKKKEEVGKRIEALSKELRRYKQDLEKIGKLEGVVIYDSAVKSEEVDPVIKYHYDKLYDAGGQIYRITSTLEPGYKAELNQVKTLKTEVDKTLEEVRTTLSKVREYKGRIAKVLGYQESKS